MSQIQTTYNPKARVVIKDLASGATKHDVSNDLVSLSTNKAYGRGSGTWQMILSYRMVDGTKRYHDMIAPNDMITIEMDAGDGTGYLPVMLGLVDRASAPRTIDAQGRPTRLVKVSGQDMGKLLNDHDIGWDIQKEKLELVIKQETEAGPPVPAQMKSVNRLWDPSYQKGTPAEFIQNLFKLTFQNVVSSSKYYDLTINTDDKWMRHMPLFGNLQGRTLWSAMKEVEHNPYNMLHCDTESLTKFQIELKKQPFDDQGRLARTPYANAVQWHTLDDAEIISDDVGVCDAERINFLFFNPRMYQQTLGLSVDVMMAHPDMVRYDDISIGLNGYHAKTINDDFLPPGMNNTNANPYSGALESTRMLTDLYWQWNKRNHEYGAGTFNVHCRPDIKSGHGLLVNQPNGTVKEYLVEQVSHQNTWGIKPVFTSTLHVTRGQKHV